MPSRPHHLLPRKLKYNRLDMEDDNYEALRHPMAELLYYNFVLIPRPNWLGGYEGRIFLPFILKIKRLHSQ